MNAALQISAGTRIGPYEVIAPVGAGGMGEVWRARDPRIGREVAIKVLPKEFAESSDRLHRFEQEARAAGSLSHPNLVTIHELGTHDGAPYIAMEMLEGATLREKLRGGHGSGGSASGVGTALPTRKAVEIAMQVATGLAAAHDKGLVHRDLKPENIFVTNDGIAKILDFGLVKLSSNFGGEFEEQATVLRSAPGVALGTVGYMSPEQVSGGTIDGRSDIFSLGAVLYELLSGRRAFHGPTAVETMNAILHEDPPALSGETSRIPPALDRIVRRCLEKEPRQRFQSARDVVFALEAMGDATSGSGERIEARNLAKRGARRWVAAVGGALALGALAGFALNHWISRRDAGSEPSYRRLTYRRGNLHTARFSPDGRTVYYAAAWDGKPAEVFAVGRDGASPQALGFKNCDLAAVSRKGELAIIRRPRDFREPFQPGVLARVPATGGAPRDVADDVIAADWFPSGEELAAIRRVGGQYVLEAPVGKVIYRSAELMGCRVSPDGAHVAIVDLRAEGLKILVLDLSGGVVRRSEPYQSGLATIAWSRAGTEVLASVPEHSLLGIGIDGSDRTILKVPGLAFLHDVAPDGVVLLELFGAWQSIGVVRAREEAITEFACRDVPTPVDLSSSGDAVLFGDRLPDSKLWGAFLQRPGQAEPVFLGKMFPFALSPDGSVVLAKSDDGRLVVVPTGAGQPQFLGSWTGQRRWHGMATIASDLQSAFVLGSPSGAKAGLYRVPLDGGTPTLLSVAALAEVTRQSPDGKLLGVTTSDLRPALLEIATQGKVLLVPGGLQQERVIGWSSDSRSVYVAADGYEPEVYRVRLAHGSREFVRRIVVRDRADLISIRVVGATPDLGVTICGLLRSTNSDLWIAEGIR
ncbi:MAG: protein kinase [Thermoanaerobaculia bacterium]|jgi:Tol biopolymer transport system component